MSTRTRARTGDEIHRELLGVLRDFLDRVGESWWAEWVQIAIEDGRFPETGRSSPPSTLDEVVIGIDRMDCVPPHQIYWANAVLDCLRCLLHRLEADRDTRSGRDGIKTSAPETDLALHCRGCLQGACERCPDDAIHAAVRRSVELACREGRFDHLLVLGRQEAEEIPAGEPVGNWSS